MEDKKLTANDGAFNDYFGSSFSIIGYTLLVGTSGKADYREAVRLSLQEMNFKWGNEAYAKELNFLRRIILVVSRPVW